MLEIFYSWIAAAIIIGLLALQGVSKVIYQCNVNFTYSGEVAQFLRAPKSNLKIGKSMPTLGMIRGPVLGKDN